MCPGVMSDAHEHRGVNSGGGDSYITAGKDGAVNGIHPNKKMLAASKPSDGPDKAVIAPPLEKITVGFFPLKVLVRRLAQDTHNRLHEVLESATMGNDLDRKRKLVNFFMERRNNFIKLLVLTKYAQKSGDISGVIDVKAWFDGFMHKQNLLFGETFKLRTDLVNAKVPNPDIKTAVEVLTAGEVSGTKNYGYIPPPKLAPENVLRLFRKINAILSFRFALHEIPPPHFRNYSIHSGRAVFTVPQEFEVALSIAREDHESQLFMVDFKLCFKPEVELPGSIRNQIESHANQMLGSKRLPGLYDFLHDFVMTHKLQILYEQFLGIAKARWVDAINVQQIKRNVRIKYWLVKGDSKSWIDIGVLAPTKDEPSRIGIRWTRDGQEVTDAKVPLDAGNLSAETIIKDVIELHTKHVLRQIQNGLLSFSVFNDSNVVFDETLLRLNIKLSPNREMSVLMEPITGRFILRPSSNNVAQFEHMINNIPVSSIHNELCKWRSRVVLDEIENRARSIGWDTPKLRGIRQDEAKKWLNSTPASVSAMLRRRSWRKEWFVICVTNNSGENWYIAHMAEAQTGWTIVDAKPLNVDSSAGISYELIKELEKVAAAFICEYTNCQELAKKKIKYTLRAIRTGEQFGKVPNVIMQTASIPQAANWATEFLRLRFMGLDGTGKAKVVVEGQAKEPMTQLKMREMSSSDADVTFHTASGGFALKFTSTVGETIVDDVIERLQRIERLIRFVSVIRRFRLSCRHVSLGRIVFIYAHTTTPIRTAEITFAGDEVKLNLPEDSPHLRIKEHLEKILNEKGLEAVILQLLVTRTLLVAFDEIDDRAREGTLEIFTRSPEWYRVAYPGKPIWLEIRLHSRRSEYWWQVREHRPQAFDANLSPLKSMWSERFSPGIEGLGKGGLAANLENIGKVIHDIHKIMSNAPSMAPPMTATSSQGGRISNAPTPMMHTPSPQQLPTQLARRALPGATPDNALSID